MCKRHAPLWIVELLLCTTGGTVLFILLVRLITSTYSPQLRSGSARYQVRLEGLRLWCEKVAVGAHEVKDTTVLVQEVEACKVRLSHDSRLLVLYKYSYQLLGNYDQGF